MYICTILRKCTLAQFVVYCTSLWKCTLCTSFNAMLGCTRNNLQGGHFASKTTCTQGAFVQDICLFGYLSLWEPESFGTNAWYRSIFWLNRLISVRRVTTHTSFILIHVLKRCVLSRMIVQNLFLGIFRIQKYYPMDICPLIVHKHLMIPKSLRV